MDNNNLKITPELDLSKVNSELQKFLKKFDNKTLNLKINSEDIQAQTDAITQTASSAVSDLAGITKQVGDFIDIYGMAQAAAQQMIQSVKDVNAAQIELESITSAPQSQLSQYYSEAIESAKKYGVAITDIISSTTNWSRAGYNLQDAKILSDATTLLQKVGDNLTNESASSGLLAVLQGFQKDASEAESIIDKVTQISKTQAIDASSLLTGLEGSASSMNAANNSLEQTLALLAAASSFIDNPETIAVAFQEMSSRISDSTSSVRKEMLSLSGVDIMLNDDTFKSTYNILDELSKKWSGLSDIQRESITELLSGDKLDNLLPGLVSNYDIARDSLDTALNKSSGSANRELDSWNKGIEASLSQFTAQFQAFANTTINSDIFKTLVDGGTAFLNVLTQVINVGGGIPALLTAISGVTIFKDLDCSNIRFQKP